MINLVCQFLKVLRFLYFGISLIRIPLGCLVLVSSITIKSAHAEVIATTGDYGGVGIFGTRTARFFEDGTLNVSATTAYPYRRYAISLQALPWLEGTFRYTEVRNRSFSLGGLQSSSSFQDRGADLKFKLLGESKWIPQIAAGLQDTFGTGLFSGEYVVASKRFYDLDFSWGIGWGLLGKGGDIKNPLLRFSDSFRGRDDSSGLANFTSAFGGETVGYFGGVQWQTPVRGLVVGIERDGNDYRLDPLNNALNPKSRYNIGFSYRPFDWIEFTTAIERGTTAMLRAVLRPQLHTDGVPKFDSPPPKLKMRPQKKANYIEQSDSLNLVLQKRTSNSSEPRNAVAKTIFRGLLPAKPKKLVSKTVAAPTQNQIQIEKNVDRLFEGLEANGFTLLNVEVTPKETLVTVTSDAIRDAHQGSAEVLSLIAECLPGTEGLVTLIQRRPDGDDRRTSLRRSDIQLATVVDFFFDGLEDYGYLVNSVELSHNAVTLFMPDSAAKVARDEKRAAEIIFQSLPIPISNVSLVTVKGGVEKERILLNRADVARASKVDQMFDELERLGFEVESLELSRGTASVYVTPLSLSSHSVFEVAAQALADIVPVSVENISLVGLSSGVEATRITIRRTIPGTESGDSGHRIENDLTDNEKSVIALKVFKAFEKADYSVDTFHLSRYKATVAVTPTRYRQFARNIGRSARIVANNVPASVEEIEVVTISAGLEIGRVSLMRQDLEKALTGSGSVEEIWANTTVHRPHAVVPPVGVNPKGGIKNPLRYPKLSWYIRPRWQQHIGGPDGLYKYQVWLAMTSTVELFRGFTAGGTLAKSLYGNFDEIRDQGSTLLPPVRSDIVRYLQDAREPYIQSLYVNYALQPFQDWFMAVRGGLLEPMFGGVGAEVLYRPLGSRLAIGADLFRARQRGFEQRFSYRDYQVYTGHLNAYYKMPFWKLFTNVHAGQFLAGDRGAKFSVGRQFDSGVTVGTWATLTNVAFSTFGEGSFDKGFYVTVPYELFLTRSTRKAGTFAFRPLTRDGGQVLGRSKQLYGIIEEGNLDNLTRDWDQFLR